MTAIEIGSSGLSAQRRRLEVLVGNLVNASTTAPDGKDPYRRRDVVFTATSPEPSFSSALGDASGAVQGVEITQIVVDPSPPVKRYEPGHPHADKDGYVAYPAINPMEEMANLLSAVRSYEANVQAVSLAKEMAVKALDILR